MAQARPLVSIIIPCHDAAAYIGDAIQSALDQTYPMKEVIVIDDGSSDESLRIIRSFGDAVRWETGPNRGGNAARNRGLALARGLLVQFLDADDLLHPEKLERQVPLALAHPDCLVYSTYACIGPGGEPLSEPRRHAPPYKGEDPVVFALTQRSISTPAPLHWREDLLAVGGFRTNLPAAQERDLHIRLACHGRGFYFHPEALVKVREVEDSVSSDWRRVLDQYSNIVQRVHEQLREEGQLTDSRREALAGLLAIGGRAYLKLGVPEYAHRYFAEARHLHPNGGLKYAYNGVSLRLARVIGPRIVQRLSNLKGWLRRFG